MADDPYIIKLIEENWKVVLLTIFLTASVVFAVMRFLFRERLANKDSRVEYLESELKRLKAQPERLLHKQLWRMAGNGQKRPSWFASRSVFDFLNIDFSYYF